MSSGNEMAQSPIIATPRVEGLNLEISECGTTTRFRARMLESTDLRIGRRTQDVEVLLEALGRYKGEPALKVEIGESERRIPIPEVVKALGIWTMHIVFSEALQGNFENAEELIGGWKNILAAIAEKDTASLGSSLENQANMLGDLNNSRADIGKLTMMPSASTPFEIHDSMFNFHIPTSQAKPVEVVLPIKESPFLYFLEVGKKYDYPYQFNRLGNEIYSIILRIFFLHSSMLGVSPLKAQGIALFPEQSQGLALVGPTGCGKTAAIRALANASGRTTISHTFSASPISELPIIEPTREGFVQKEVLPKFFLLFARWMLDELQRANSGTESANEERASMYYNNREIVGVVCTANYGTSSADSPIWVRALKDPAYRRRTSPIMLSASPETIGVLHSSKLYYDAFNALLRLKDEILRHAPEADHIQTARLIEGIDELGDNMLVSAESGANFQNTALRIANEAGKILDAIEGTDYVLTGDNVSELESLVVGWNEEISRVQGESKRAGAGQASVEETGSISSEILSIDQLIDCFGKLSNHFKEKQSKLNGHIIARKMDRRRIIEAATDPGNRATLESLPDDEMFWMNVYGLIFAALARKVMEGLSDDRIDPGIVKELSSVIEQEMCYLLIAPPENLVSMVFGRLVDPTTTHGEAHAIMGDIRSKFDHFIGGTGTDDLLNGLNEMLNTASASQSQGTLALGESALGKDQAAKYLRVIGDVELRSLVINAMSYLKRTV